MANVGVIVRVRLFMFARWRLKNITAVKEVQMRKVVKVRVVHVCMTKRQSDDNDKYTSSRDSTPSDGHGHLHDCIRMIAMPCDYFQLPTRKIQEKAFRLDSTPKNLRIFWLCFSYDKLDYLYLDYKLTGSCKIWLLHDKTVYSMFVGFTVQPTLQQAHGIEHLYTNCPPATNSTFSLKTFCVVNNCIVK